MIGAIEKLKTNSISKRGGARPGAGRKPKLKYEARELFNMAVDERWPLIVAKLDDLIAKGDKDVLRFVIEQRIGKPGQSVEVKNNQHIGNNYNLFLNPKVQVALKAYEETLIEAITNTPSEPQR